MKIKALLSSLLVAALLLSPVALMEEVSEPQNVVSEEAAPVVNEEEKAEHEEDTEQPDTQVVASEEDDSQIDEEASVETDQEIASEPVGEVVMEVTDVDLSEAMEGIDTVENEKTLDDNNELPLVEDSVTLSEEVDCASSDAMYAATNPYWQYQHYPYYDQYGNAEEIANCTYVAWQQAYDRLGIALPAWGNATYWYSNAEGVYPKGTEPRVNSIACYSGDPGHVAYVIGVNGNNITVVENGHWNGTYENSLATRTRSGAIGSKYGASTLVGYIYLTCTASIDRGMNGIYNIDDIASISLFPTSFDVCVLKIYRTPTGGNTYLYWEGEVFSPTYTTSFPAEGHYSCAFTVTRNGQTIESSWVGWDVVECRASINKGQDGLYALNEEATISVNTSGFNTCILYIYRTPTNGETYLYWEGEIFSSTYKTSFPSEGYYSCEFVITKNGKTFHSAWVGWIVSDNSSTTHTHTPKTVNGYAATCGKMGLSDGVKCDVCGVWITNQTTIPATGNHSWGAWTTTQAPTCTAEGRKVHTCSVCQQTRSESIVANGHTEQTVKGKAPTNTSTGLTDGVQCSVCKIWLIPQEVIAAKTGNSVPPSGGSSSSADPVVASAPAPVPAAVVAQEPVTITKAPASIKTKAKKGTVTVSWKKIKKSKKTKALLAQIKSIQVQYSTDPNFATDVNTKTLGKKKTKAVLKLQRKTTYYVRVRYVGSDGVSNWSATKKVKTKK